MKKILSVSLKSIIFFVGWAICASVLPIPNTESAVLWRFWAELIPFLAVIAMTVFFWLIERKKVQLHLIEKPVSSVVLGLVTGTIWLGASVAILFLMRVLHIQGSNKVPFLWLWIINAFINTLMQEMLVRGYLYQMIKSKYNVIAATIVSTALFTLAHGGAFEAGIIPVLNVLTMSLFMTVVLEYTNSLLAPIVIHFLWNSIGAIILGGVSLAEDYPHVYNMVISGNELLSGGIYRIEGSGVVLVLNLLMIVGFVIAKKKRDEL